MALDLTLPEACLAEDLSVCLLEVCFVLSQLSYFVAEAGWIVGVCPKPASVIFFLNQVL